MQLVFYLQEPHLLNGSGSLKGRGDFSFGEA